MTDSDNEKQYVLVGGTLYAIETGPGNENRYEIHSGFGGDYLVDTHNLVWIIGNFIIYSIIAVLSVIVFVLLVIVLIIFILSLIF
ncbi:MAG: hypothetical protein LBP87_10750 [Planctomycetaceae bacterium]|jgi:hypothetical protein|nr:hypothetical protein [Planctomycetaceae bacterium]